MKYGDIVTYVRDGVESNALVYSHDAQSDAITLAFFDPALDSQGLKPAAATILRGVQRLGRNAKIGWREVSELANDVTSALLKLDLKDGDMVFFDARTADVVGGLAHMDWKSAPDVVFIPVHTLPGQTLAETIEIERKPSAADLDAHADEQKAKELTTQTVEYPCGCSATGPVVEGASLPNYCPEHGTPPSDIPETGIAPAIAEGFRAEGEQSVTQHEHSAEGGLTNVTDEEVQAAEAHNQESATVAQSPQEPPAN